MWGLCGTGIGEQAVDEAGGAEPDGAEAAAAARLVAAGGVGVEGSEVVAGKAVGSDDDRGCYLSIV
jgi:hypothetical protein